MISLKRDEQLIFITTLERYLHQVMQKFINKDLTRETLEQIKQEIRDRLLKVFGACDFHISDDSINFLTCEYFATVTINGQSLTELLLMNNPSVDTVPTCDLDVLIDLFRDTTIGEKLVASRQRRS